MMPHNDPSADTPAPKKLTYSAKEAAGMIGCSVTTLNEHVRYGRIRCVIVGGGKHRKHRRFTMQNINSFLQKQKVREVPPCLSTAIPVHRTTSIASSSAVVDFLAVPKPGTEKQPNK
jgi:metal-dependent hydrolase (beta-lactamase superfamily II)